MCKSWCEAIIGLIILVVAIWPGIFGAAATWWITIIAAIVLIIHSFTCKTCFAGMNAKKRR